MDSSTRQLVELALDTNFSSLSETTVHECKRRLIDTFACAMGSYDHPLSATVRNLKANLAISMVMKAAFVALAIVGVATLWMAVVADTGASVIVIANALRLLRAD